MRLATITTGSGPIKVGLVHGLGASGATWEPLIDRMLSDGRYTVIAVDLRGHGSSERAASYKLDDFADHASSTLSRGSRRWRWRVRFRSLLALLGLAVLFVR